MLVGRAGRLVGQFTRAQVVGVKAVVGDDDNGGVVTRQLPINPQHQIMVLITDADDILVEFIILFVDPFQARWVVLHETVAEMVDAVKIDTHEIPRLQLHQRRRGGMDAGNFRQHLGNRADAFVFFLVDFGGAGYEGQQHVAFQLAGMDAEFF